MKQDYASLGLKKEVKDCQSLHGQKRADKMCERMSKRGYASILLDETLTSSPLPSRFFLLHILHYFDIRNVFLKGRPAKKGGYRAVRIF